jgi:hypothetical protein
MLWVTANLLPGNDLSITADDRANIVEVAVDGTKFMTIVGKLSGTMGKLASCMSHGKTIRQYWLHIFFKRQSDSPGGEYI